MEEEENNNNEFEKPTLTNIWLKDSVLDIMSSINYNESLAQDGDLDLQYNEGLLMQSRYNGYRSMKTQISILLSNCKPLINKEVYDKVNLTLAIVTRNNDLIMENETYPDGGIIRVRRILAYFFDDFFLPRIKECKQLLFDEISDKELLLPKKSDKKDKKISTLEDG